MAIPIENDWRPFFDAESAKPYYKQLRAFLKGEYASRTVYPPMGDIFNALRYTPLASVRVVILGQDPYINPGQAHGLSFSVLPGAAAPPSLLNIYKELHDDLGCRIPNNGHLTKWAAQGVLLLNNTLTTRAGASGSHGGQGWEAFTAAAIGEINRLQTPVVFLLWGRQAQTKAELITNPKHLTLQAAHPSPLARGAFFGCRHFSKANAFLAANGLAPIDWQIEDI